MAHHLVDLDQQADDVLHVLDAHLVVISLRDDLVCMYMCISTGRHMGGVGETKEEA